MEQTNSSILSCFPEYGFKSTTVYNRYSSKRRWFLTLIIIVEIFIGVLILGTLFDGILDEFFSGDMSIFILVILSVIYLILLEIWDYKWFLKGISTAVFADYIQTKGRYLLFVKDGKFGLVKSFNFKILIPAMYDKLMWVQDNEVLKAYLNGDELLLDIHNNKLK